MDRKGEASSEPGGMTMEKYPQGDTRFDEFFGLLRSHLLALDSAEDQKRIRRIGAETLQAMQKLARVHKAVSIFGSAQPAVADRWGERARKTARQLSEAGFAVITGGGPGVMAAANEGAAQGSSESIGLTISLPRVEPANPHVTLEVPFRYFFLRKFMFVKYSLAFICFPGGFGTLDELFEALNLRRTAKLAPFPIVLFGRDHWHGLLEWLRTAGVSSGALTADDVELMQVVDTPEEVLQIVRACYADLCKHMGINGDAQQRDRVS